VTPKLSSHFADSQLTAAPPLQIKNVKICKAAWVWPFQRCMRFSVQPHDYSMTLQAMTKEKLQFMLPVVFTVGPDINHRGANSRYGSTDGESHDSPSHDADDNIRDANHREDRGDALMKYAMLLAESDGSRKGGNSEHLGNIVRGIIEGEVRVLVSSMTMEEIFTEREVFKQRIYRNIQTELDKLGLKIWNANVKELKDAKESHYFESLSKKAHEGATSQVRLSPPFRLLT
jgi:flotillin